MTFLYQEKKPYEKWLVILKKILIKKVISFAECHWLIFFGAFLLNNVVSRIGFTVEKSYSWTDILSWRQCWSYRFLEFWGLTMENSSLFLPCVFANLWFWQLLMIASFCYPFYTSWIQWGPQRLRENFESLLVRRNLFLVILLRRKDLRKPLFLANSFQIWFRSPCDSVLQPFFSDFIRSVILDRKTWSIRVSFSVDSWYKKYSGSTSGCHCYWWLLKLNHTELIVHHSGIIPYFFWNFCTYIKKYLAIYSSVNFQT